jgi:hypothetical protein
MDIVVAFQHILTKRELKGGKEKEKERACGSSDW